MPFLRPTAAVILASFYFAGPLLILGELLRPEIAIPLLLLFLLWALPLAAYWLGTVPSPPQPSLRPSTLSSLLAAGLCIIWVYFSGIGGYAHLHFDYPKHNFIFSVLINDFLPLRDDITGRPIHYYFAYYITPVRIYQLLQSFNINVELDATLLCLYSAALFLSMIVLTAGRASILVLSLMFAFAGGLDLLGLLAFDSPSPIVATLPFLGIGLPMSLEWWGIPFAPQSLTNHLYWAPQHFFAALIGTALIYSFFDSTRPTALLLVDTLILVTASAYWSPYVAVGLGAFTLAKITVIERERFRTLRERDLAPLLTFAGLSACTLAAAFALMTLVFYAAADSTSMPSLLLNKRKEALPWLLTYTINYAPLIAMLCLMLLPRLRGGTSSAFASEDTARSVLRTLAACLVASAIVLLVTHGKFNDWSLRTTLPLSIVLTLAMTQAISFRLKRSSLVLMIGIIAFSSASSLTQFAQAILLPPNRVPYGSFVLNEIGIPRLPYKGRSDSTLYRFVISSQYEGRSDSILYRYLVRSR